MCNVFKWLLNGYFISIRKPEKKYYYIHDNNYECFKIYLSKSALPMPMRRVYWTAAHIIMVLPCKHETPTRWRLNAGPASQTVDHACPYLWWGHCDFKCIHVSALAQLSQYVHNGGLKPHSFHFYVSAVKKHDCCFVSLFYVHYAHIKGTSFLGTFATSTSTQWPSIFLQNTYSMNYIKWRMLMHVHYTSVCSHLLMRTIGCLPTPRVAVDHRYSNKDGRAN